MAVNWKERLIVIVQQNRGRRVIFVPCRSKHNPKYGSCHTTIVLRFQAWHGTTLMLKYFMPHRVLSRAERLAILVVAAQKWHHPSPGSTWRRQLITSSGYIRLDHRSSSTQNSLFLKEKRKKRKLTFDVERNSSRHDFSLQLSAQSTLDQRNSDKTRAAGTSQLNGYNESMNELIVHGSSSYSLRSKL